MNAGDDLFRDVDLPALLAALGVDPADPRCPACDGSLEIGGDARSGFSLRCASRCRLAALGFAWPPSFAAEAWRTPTLGAARERLRASIAAHEVERAREGVREAARRRLTAFLAAGSR